ncbi:Gifsy-2 prophage VmtV [Salmonella enterica subsp. enterica serovar Typhimurium]|nr:Gifsy-2 prophage VmtV [Salmonella enterica subsp. enterica serovar Typhimurium]
MKTATPIKLNQIAGKSLREQARWFDNNHDLVVGALDKMEERVIGAKGIIVEPQPLTVAGTLNNALAEQIRARWARVVRVAGRDRTIYAPGTGAPFVTHMVAGRGGVLPDGGGKNAGA